MIQEFVDRWMAEKDVLERVFQTRHPENYEEIVKRVFGLVNVDADLDKIHCIDDGDYQGTLLFLVPENCYQPSTYWYVKVSYGSCSGCDTLQDIRCYSDDVPTSQQVSDYMTLALHIVQGIKKLED